MKNNIMLDIEKNIFSVTALMSIIIALLIFIQKIIDSGIGNYSYGNLISYYFLFTPFLNFAPIFVSVVSSAGICDDIKDGYIKSILLRQSRKKYAINKFISCTVSGGCVLAFAVIILMIIVIICGFPDEKNNNLWGGPFDKVAFESIQYVGGGLLTILTVIILSFIFGMVWSGVGLAFSVFIPNKYLTIAFPLMVYYAINMLLNEFQELIKFTPANTIVPGTLLVPSIGFILTEQLIAFFIITVIYFLGIKRRLKNV